MVGFTGFTMNQHGGAWEIDGNWEANGPTQFVIVWYFGCPFIWGFSKSRWNMVKHEPALTAESIDRWVICSILSLLKLAFNHSELRHQPQNHCIHCFPQKKWPISRGLTSICIHQAIAICKGPRGKVCEVHRGGCLIQQIHRAWNSLHDLIRRKTKTKSSSRDQSWPIYINGYVWKWGIPPMK